ncbi:MAG: hypothetical protein RJB11_1897, partial [Planctomycetota bacterium]
DTDPPGKFAEGWTRHLHLGYSTSPFDPLKDALGDLVVAIERELTIR